MLGNPDFDVLKFNISDPEVQTLATKLHNVVMNGNLTIGTDETFTDTLVDDVLRIAKLNHFPLMIRNHMPCKIYIEDKPLLSTTPEFVVQNKDYTVIGVEDKHLKNVGPVTGFGESQIAIEIVACGCENMRSIGYKYKKQTIFVIHVISTYFTFYKADIPAKYWKDLEKGLPKDSLIEVQRWPTMNGLMEGFDFAKPEGRKIVLEALAKFRHFLLPKKQSDMYKQNV
ncbi:hypothetical protein Glove_209g101 [Diversispora epigaea]|uniref:Uncharacterized protein n=1 Tax=Diversispora epigaea TaxID=1348612 RepID=A0A397IIP5_9GLOM|nr:hypothetical protein Glove_209g101 [Diversispora epigaea]